MASRYPAIDLSELRTVSIRERKSKVSVEDFASPLAAGAGVDELLTSLPDIFAGKWIRTIIERIARAHQQKRAVVLAMGAHVIKCGLSPILCDLMKRGVITSLAVNGAGAIHDSEIARFGQTSEDVVDGMRTGLFGMARETADFLNEGASTAQSAEMGFGEVLGKALAEHEAPHADVSLLATAYRCGVPMTVHVSVGSDIVHMHASADGNAIGAASMRDFRILTEAMTGLGQGGVLLNVGSAVVLPEVLLKAMTILVNLGRDLSGMTGVNLDFMQQYRSNQQVVSRIREIGGEGFALTGHHEIMIPLIAAGVVQRLGKEE